MCTVIIGQKEAMYYVKEKKQQQNPKHQNNQK